MAGFETVNPPGGMSYGAPLIDFGIIGNLANTYYQGNQNRFQQQQSQHQQDIATAFQNGLPVDSNGAPDYGKIMQILAQKGDINAIPQLGALQQNATLRSQAGQLSPLLAGATAPVTQASAPQPSPAQPISVASIPAPPATGLNAGDNPGSVVDIIGAKLPQDSATTGAVITNIARAVGVDPNAPLTAAQSARVQQLADAYLRRRPQAAAPVPAASASPASPNDRVAATFGGMGAPDREAGGLPPASAALAARTIAQPAEAPTAEAAVASAAPTAAPQSQPAPHAIMPQVPLPPGFKPGQEPQAVMALRREAARLSNNQYAAGQVKLLEDWATKIESSMAPIKVGQADTIIDPRTGQVIVQGPAAAAFGARGPSQTLDADAELYRQTGRLPPNMGRGVQGQQEAHTIRTRAAEMEIANGGNPADWSTRWQQFATRAAGLRTFETRAAGLTLAENEARTLIPRVRDISAKISRTDYPTINSLILAAKKHTGGEDVIRLGVAVESLIPVYARVLKPTGQIGVADTERAHQILDKAWSDGQINAALDQMEIELKSAKQALRDARQEYGGAASRDEQSAPAAAPKSAPAADWVTLPNGIRYRPVSQ